MVASSSGRRLLQVHDLGLDAFGRERSGGLKRLPQRTAISDEGDVASRAPHPCRLDIDRAGLGRKRAGHVVKHDVLEDEHGIGVFERRPQHSARIFDGGRRKHLDAGDVRIPSLQAVRVLGGKLAPRPSRHADHERHAELVTRHVPDRGGTVQNLVEREEAEIDRHDLDDGAHPRHRRADACAGEARFQIAACREYARVRTPQAGLWSPRSSRHSGRHPRP